MATEAVDDHCSFDLETVAVAVAVAVVVVVEADIVAVVEADIVAVVEAKVVVVAYAELVVAVVQMRLDNEDVSECFRSLVEAETTTAADHLVV